MNIMTKMVLFIVGKWQPHEEIHDIKNETFNEISKTNRAIAKVNKLLYTRDRTYDLGKAMGVFRK